MRLNRMNRNRNNEPLSNDQIQRYAPSVFAGQAHDSRSQRYAFIPTVEVIDGLRQAGLVPVAATQSRSRIAGKEYFTKHMIRFRSTNEALTQVGDTAVEVVLVNSHDGTSQYELSLGAFRLACLNGMMVSEGLVQSVKVRHTGNIIERVVELTHSLVQQAPLVTDAIKTWKQIEMDQNEQQILAESALALRFDGTAPITADKLLMVNRNADAHNDLWTVFNRIQENAVRGGIRYYSESTPGDASTMRRNRTREVAGIDNNSKLNRELFALAAKFAALKSAK